MKFVFFFFFSILGTCELNFNAQLSSFHCNQGVSAEMCISFHL